MGRKNLVFILIFLLASIGLYSDDPLSILLDKAGLNIMDLNFQKDWDRDTVFKISTVKKALNSPGKFLKDIEEYDYNVDNLDLYVRKYGDYSLSIEESMDSLAVWIKNIRSLYNMEEKKYIAMVSSDFWNPSDGVSLKGKFFSDRNIYVDTSKTVKDTIFYKMLSKVRLETFIKIYKVLNKLTISLDSLSLKKLREIDGIEIGGTGNNVYTKYPLILVDPGGDDIYINPASIFFDSLPFHIIIDKAGNDKYTTNISLGLGSAFMGAVEIFDKEGNDVYIGKDYSISSSIMGVSIIYDSKGDDYYSGGIASVSSATFGISRIEDLEGNDVYVCSVSGEGFGGPRGIGILSDKGGDDTYRSGLVYKHSPLLPKDNISLSQGFGMGWRPDVSGGIGILRDYSGNDFYNAGVFAQGASYWNSLGILLDDEGQDFYNGVEYCQGAGIHLSTGILIDRSGDDVYYARLGPSQGEGHDLSVGYLNDMNGNDFYYTSGGQGIGLTNSVGIFIDNNGDDFYGIKEKNKTFGEGRVTEARGFRGIGLFWDGEGKDLYVNPFRKDSLFSRDRYLTGIFYDYPLDTPDLSREVVDTIPGRELTIKIDSLFSLASIWEVGDAREQVRRARKAMKQRWKESWDYILKNKMNTKSGLEIRAILELIKYVPDSVRNDLEKLVMTHSVSNEGLLNTIYFLGTIKDTTFLKKLTKDSLFLSRETHIRSLLNAIYMAPFYEADKFILNYIGKKFEEKTRIYAFRALDKNIRLENLYKVIPYLCDKNIIVRYAAQKTLLKYPDESVNIILESMGNKKEKCKIEALKYIRRNAKNLKLYYISIIDKL